MRDKSHQRSEKRNSRVLSRDTYDSFGRNVRVEREVGVVTTTGYDANGNVVSEEGASYPVRFAYDSQGRRVSMQTNRRGETWDETRWTYDPSTGLCTLKTYEDGSVVRYEYTPDGLLETTRTADGHWTRNVYDAKRQVVGVCYDGGNDGEERVRPDCHSRLPQ